ILMARTSPAPFAVTFTFPPPALTSTVLLSSSACVLAICSCIFCACFISLFKFMVFALLGGRALAFLDYLSIEQPDRFFDKRISLKIFRSRTLRGRCLFGRKFFPDGKLHTPARSGNFMEQCFKKFAIGLRPQDIHHRFVARRETKLEIAPFDPKDVGCSSRISHEGLLRGNFDQSSLPELVRIR